MNLSHLDGRVRICCVAPGVEGIVEGDILGMRVWSECHDVKSGGLRARACVARIELLAADGTRHHFHVRDADLARAEMESRQPAGRSNAAPVRHHPVATFARHFQVPVPASMPEGTVTAPQDALLDLLEAVSAAFPSTGAGDL